MPEQELSPQTTYGAEIRAVPEGRSMKYYPVFKLELETIATFNSLSTIFVGLAGAVFMTLVGFIWDLQFTGPISTASETATWTLIVLAFLALVVCGGLAIWFQKKKKSVIHEIISQKPEGDVVISET